MAIGICQECGEKRFIPEETNGLCMECALKLKEENMASRGICKACGREMSIKARGLCGACYEKYKNSQQADTSIKPALKVSIDFTDYPEILEAIKQKAREDFRTVELEMLYLLREATK